ncbi:trigger factor [Candidatus Parcubacteria bacterium]|nr:MAG: trigger factor [Candidatus Parcubacteria bacterium]
MKIEKESLPKGIIKLIIEISADEMAPYLQKAAAEISKNLNISGFRPGHAPLEIVRNEVGEQRLWEEAANLAVSKTFYQTVTDKKIYTVGAPKIKIIKLAFGNPFIYQADVSVLPDVIVGNISEITVKKKRPEIGDNEVSKSLTELQKMRHTEILENKKAEKGDKVEIDFNIFLDKVPVEHGEQKKFPLVIGEGGFIPGFEENLTGLKANEEKSFRLEFPKEYHNKNLAGKKAEFKVRVLSVYKINLPEINDDFGKALGFNDLADLKKKLKENLEHEAMHKEEERIENEMIEKLINITKYGDIPEVLINEETKKMVFELEENIKKQGIKFDDYLRHLKKKKEELLLDFAPQAIKRIKSALLLRELAKQNKIEVSGKEIDEEIKKVVQMYGADSKIREQTRSKDYHDYLQNILITRKTMDFLKSKTVKS